MQFKLENPQHQKSAIQSVVEVFRGMERNTYDNAHIEDIHTNICSLSTQQLHENIQRVIQENSVPDSQSFLCEEKEACIEMETGTGKTLTYIQTAYELNRVWWLVISCVLMALYSSQWMTMKYIIFVKFAMKYLAQTISLSI